MRNDILNRRRMISESSGWEKLDSFVDILKSMGCVFYLPLNSEDESAITDVISGNKIQLNSNYGSSNFSYDDTKKMYKIINASSGSWVGKVKFNLSGFNDNSCTYLGIMFVDNNPGAKAHSNFILDAEQWGGSDTYYLALCLYYTNSTGRTRHFADVSYPRNTNLYIAGTLTPKYRRYYCGSSNPSNVTQYLGNVPVYNSYQVLNWSDGRAQNLYIGAGDRTSAYCKTWMSNYMVFNRELSISEIKNIFNLVTENNKLLYKRRIKSLSITANDVPGRKTNTTINYVATWEYKYEDGTREEKIETGTATSEEFPQNTSYTDTVQRTIKFTLGGKTVETTITQGVWIDKEYIINLNSQWLKSSITNPDSSLYDGVYESYSNKGVHNSGASMYITINGYSNFKLYIRSYAESSYDYVMVSQLDKTLTYNSNYSDTSLVKSHTRSSQNSGTSIGSYLLVEFTNIDGGEHTIQIIYRKDGSLNSGNDCGYVLIPKDQ